MAEEGPRALWDIEWIEGGCVGDPPPLTNADDTFGTYSTNYLIMVIGIGVAVATAFETPRSWSGALRIATFGLLALGYGLAGVLHQFFRTEDVIAEQMLTWKISYMLTVLGTLALTYYANQLLAKKCSLPPPCRWALFGIVTLSGVVVVLVIMIPAEPSLIITGAASILYKLYAAIVFGVDGDFGSATGVFLMIVGMVIQVVLAPQCGRAAYADCFKDCPLPAPYFNHNALFHVVFAVGMAVLAVALAASSKKHQGEEYEALNGMPRGPW